MFGLKIMFGKIDTWNEVGDSKCGLLKLLPEIGNEGENEPDDEEELYDGTLYELDGAL